MGYIRFALALAFAAGTLMFPERALAAALKSMTLWLNSVAPALFPFAAVMPYITSPQARYIYDKLLGWLVRRLFRLPGSCASAIVTGFFAGSPGGALATARVAVAEGLSAGQAARLAGIACGVGPIYIVSGVGAALMGATEEGWRLAVAQWLALAATGALFSRLWNDGSAGKMPFSEPPAENPIQASVMAVLRVCGYMTLFSVGIAMAECFAGRELWQISLIADLPSGVAVAIEKNMQGSAIAACISFGGLCIAAQNMSILSKVGVTWKRYLLQKIATAALSAGIYELCGTGAIRASIAQGGEFEAALLVMTAIMLPITAAFLMRKKRIVD